MVRIFCKNTGKFGEFTEGVTLLEALKSFDFDKPYDIIAAKVNNVPEGLMYRVFKNKDVEFLDYRNYSGRNLYCRSLSFLLCKAADDVLPGCQVVLRRPISKGYFVAIRKKEGGEVLPTEIEAIKERMRQLVEQKTPFKRHEVQAEAAIRCFKEMGAEDKVKIIESSDDTYITYYTLGGYADLYYDALLPHCGYLKVWELERYEGGGLLLRVPDRHTPEQLAPCHPQPKTFEIFAETLRWNKIMGLETVGDVNQACLNGRASELIQVAEALQEKKIVQIAEEIDARYKSAEPVKIVLITGPSSSGKSTFCKRLSIQLKACGLHPISFSTDDYFVNRVDTPKLPDGQYDFDNFDTVDHDYLQEDVLKLLAGEEVEVPQYNFVTGRREFNGKKLKLSQGSILLVEGIHALNPMLTNKVKDSAKFKIFINTITSISLDHHNCIPTSDNRLLRRVVRDFNMGSFSAQQTIANWPNVRRAEVKWIYPYQEDADVLFNSAYLVEFAVIRNHAEAILRSVPRNSPEYSEAHKLLNFLHYFVRVSDKDVPATSLIRGFIGGSSFSNY